MRTNSINANNDFAKDLRGINRKVKLAVAYLPLILPLKETEMKTGQFQSEQEQVAALDRSNRP